MWLFTTTTHWIRRIPPQRFNRLCGVAALLWLMVTIPPGIVWRPTWPDFAQFYMGGLVARTGQWSSLYPIPKPTSLDNPGLKRDSYPKPAWARLARQYDVPDETRFILPPPSALLFIPLSLMSYQVAFWVWTFLLIGCTWGVAILAGRSYRLLTGQESRWEGLLAMATVLSPMVARAIRIENVTPPVALCIGVATMSLASTRTTLREAVAIALGAMLKYATLVLLPLFMLTRRWRTLAWLAVAGAGVLLITLLLTGTGPFEEYFSVIAPLLDRPSAFPGNQSLPGLLARTLGRPLPPGVVAFLDTARLLTLAGILLLFFRMAYQDLQRPEGILSGAAALVSWMMIFSPVVWEHWPIFLVPFWGWLLWEAHQSPSRRLWAVLAFALMYFPAGLWMVRGFFMRKIQLPEPLNSTQLAGVVVVLILAASRLAILARKGAESAGITTYPGDKAKLPGDKAKLDANIRSDG